MIPFTSESGRSRACVQPFPVNKVFAMLMPDSRVFDHIRQTLHELRRVAPNSATRITLEAALRSVSPSPRDDAGGDGAGLSQEEARAALTWLIVVVRQSEIRFGGPHRRRLAICAMWLRTAERCWNEADRRSTTCLDRPSLSRAS
jgi:hypothetical protein